MVASMYFGPTCFYKLASFPQGQWRRKIYENDTLTSSSTTASIV